MKERKDLLAYCGLYCGDCAGYSGETGNTAKNLMKVLEKYKFDRTAKCLFSEKLGDNDKFCSITCAMLNTFLSAHPSIEKCLDLLFISSHVKRITHTGKFER